MSDEPVAEVNSKGKRVFRCKAAGCNFESRKPNNLKSHLDQSHNHCWKCNIFFDDWQDMVDHKFQHPKHVNDPEEIPICQFCGIEFQYQVEREEHYIRFHPLVHSLECIGCKKSFDSPASYIDHIERGYCRKITSDNFYGRVQHKLVLRDILSSPENVQRLLRKDFTGAADDNDTSTNGVSLSPIPTNDGAHKKKSKNDESGVPIAKFDGLERFQQLRSGLYSPSTTTDSDTASSRSPVEEGFTPHEISPELLSKFLALDSSTSTTLRRAGLLAKNRGGHRDDEDHLEPEIELLGLTHSWEEEEDMANKSGSGCIFEPGGDHLFGLATWDPNHPDFNCEPFYNPVQECYACPYPHCGAQLPTRMSVQEHFASRHAMREAKCPSCVKSFKKFSALISHVTSQGNRRCKVYERDDFKDIVDFITGGLVAVKETKGKREEGMEGKFVKRYRAAIPLEWDVGDGRTKVVIGRNAMAAK